MTKNKTIFITGIAGSGKSSVCDELQKRGYMAYDVESIEGLFAMVNKKTGKNCQNHDNDNLEDSKQCEWICDIEQLEKLLKNNSDKITFYCGTASNFDELIPLFDRVLLLVASPETIRQRLSSRKTGQFGNTPDVQNWVLSWKGWWEDQVKEKDVTIINADQNIKYVVEDILSEVL